MEKSSHFSTKGGEIVGETVLNLQNTFLSACGNVCFFQYESKRLCYTNDSKKYSYQSKKMRDRKVSCNMEFQRVNISGGSSFEEVAGYSRIVKADLFPEQLRLHRKERFTARATRMHRQSISLQNW